MCLSISQLVPSYPGGQVQLNEFATSSQEPPFLHGLESQSFMSANRKSTSCSLKRKINDLLVTHFVCYFICFATCLLNIFKWFSFLEITFFLI